MVVYTWYIHGIYMVYTTYILAVSETYLLCTFELLSCATMLCACISNSAYFHSVPVRVPKSKITQNGICLAYTRYIHVYVRYIPWNHVALLSRGIMLCWKVMSSTFDCPQPWHGFTTLKLQENIKLEFWYTWHIHSIYHVYTVALHDIHGIYLAYTDYIPHRGSRWTWIAATLQGQQGSESISKHLQYQSTKLQVQYWYMFWMQISKKLQNRISRISIKKHSILKILRYRVLHIYPIWAIFNFWAPAQYRIILYSISE